MTYKGLIEIVQISLDKADGDPIDALNGLKIAQQIVEKLVENTKKKQKKDVS